MRHSRWILAFAILFAVCVRPLWAQESPAAAPPESARPSTEGQPATANEESNKTSTKYLRLTRDDQDRPIALETAIVTFAPADPSARPLKVDLVAAIHIGERSYYEELNKAFDAYEVVLYELVAPEGTRVPQGGGGPRMHPLAMMQDGMRNMLKLESQIELVNYERDNFVHADISPDEFAASMERRGENIWAIFFRMLGQSMVQQARNPRRNNDLEMMRALFDRSRSGALKQLLAEQFTDLEGAMSIFEGPNGSTIITERNQAAVKVLAKQIADGKQKIAVFYGAGHMPDMQKRLIDDLGLERADERWLVAWNLADPKSSQPKADE